MLVAPEIASCVHCACEPVTVHGCTRVFMIVAQLRSTHAVVCCIVKTTSRNTTPQEEGVKLNRRVINANCVKCAHQHRERRQEHAPQCIWNHRALTSERTNLGGKHKKKTLLNTLVGHFLLHTFLLHVHATCANVLSIIRTAQCSSEYRQHWVSAPYVRGTWNISVTLQTSCIYTCV